jgi:hypothetical protein
MGKIEMIALGKMGFPPRISGELGDGMKTPDEVLAMIRLKECGSRAFAACFNCSTSRQTEMTSAIFASNSGSRRSS